MTSKFEVEAGWAGEERSEPLEHQSLEAGIVSIHQPAQDFKVTTVFPVAPSSFSPSLLVLRPAHKEEVEQLAQLEALSFSAPWSLASLQSLMDQPAFSLCCCVAETEGASPELLGYLAMLQLGEEAELLRLAISPAHRRRGLARFALLEWLGQHPGCQEIFLEVRESNQPARRLYESLGFQQLGRRKKYYQQPVEDALLYRFRRGDV